VFYKSGNFIRHHFLKIAAPLQLNVRYYSTVWRFPRHLLYIYRTANINFKFSRFSAPPCTWGRGFSLPAELLSVSQGKVCPVAEAPCELTHYLTFRLQLNFSSSSKAINIFFFNICAPLRRNQLLHIFHYKMSLNSHVFSFYIEHFCCHTQHASRLTGVS
jgi:hypothetical protein